MRVTIVQDSREKCTCFLLGDSGFPLKSISLILTPILNLTSPSKLHLQPWPKPKPTTQQTGQLLHRLVAMTLDWMLLSRPHDAACAPHFILFVFFCLAVSRQKLRVTLKCITVKSLQHSYLFWLSNQKHNTTQSWNIHRKCFIHTEHPELSTLSTFQTSTVYHVCCLCSLGHGHCAKNTYAFLFHLLYERDLFN